MNARAVFFARPRYRTLAKPQRRLTTWKACSPRARRWDRPRLPSHCRRVNRPFRGAFRLTRYRPPGGPVLPVRFAPVGLVPVQVALLAWSPNSWDTQGLRICASFGPISAR